MAARREWLDGSTVAWTKENRARYDRRNQKYPSARTPEEWRESEPLLPVTQGIDRPRTYSLQGVINSIYYVQRYGIPWGTIPKDLPWSGICYEYWRVLVDGGHLERINHHLVMRDRDKDGRGASPALAIIEAQSVKCDAPQGERGYDAGEKVLGRQRHLVVDSGGRLLAVSVTPANVQDQDGGLALVNRPVRHSPWVETGGVEGGYTKRFIDAVQSGLKRAVEVVLRPAGSKGFVLLPKRWRVEQRIGALTDPRRLEMDDETLLHVSAGAILFTSIGWPPALITIN